MSGQRLEPLGRLSGGERLVIERRRRKETQVKAAERFDVTPFVYGQWERDKVEGPQPPTFQLTQAEQCLLYRRRLGWTQDAVAYIMGLSRTWVNQMERGLIPCKDLIEYWEM